jgi:polysaccharide biosynthesis/export protein
VFAAIVLMTSSYIGHGVATQPLVVQPAECLTLLLEGSFQQSAEKAATSKKASDSPGAQSGTASAAPTIPGYRVGADDELNISVWHEPELSQSVVVRPDGMITLPLLNDVSVAGLTTEEMQALLTEKLKALVNDPQVTVSVKTVKSQRVFLMGAVGKQGVYPLAGKTTVLQLIAQGGGLGAFAKTRAIYILRHQDGKDLRIPFNYKKALAGKGDDPVLQSGDMVVVP